MVRIDPRVLPNHYGLRPNHIRSAVRHATRNPEVLRSPKGNDYVVYAQDVTATSPPRCVVAVTEVMGGERHVTGAHVVPADLVGPIDTPLEMLRALAERFGVHIDLPDRPERFVLWQRIPKPDSGLLQMAAALPPGHIGAGNAIYHQREDEGEVDLVMAFVVNATEVRNYLDSA